MTETPQVNNSPPTHIHYRNAATKFSGSEVVHLASDVLRYYPSFKSAFIVGPYARNFPEPSAIITIVACTHDQGDPVDVERVHMHLEMKMGKPVEFLVSTPEDVMNGKKRWGWIPLG